MAENTNTEREADALIRKLRDVLDEARTYIGAPTFSPSMDSEAAVAVEEAELYLAGRASLSLPAAGQEPMFWVRLCSDGLYEGPIHNARIEKVRRQSGAWSPLYLGAAPQPAVAAGWVSAKVQLPPCRDDQEYIGINTAGFAGVFNAVRVIEGNTYCVMETAEEMVSIMSDLDIWKPFIRPAPSTEGESNG